MKKALKRNVSIIYYQKGSSRVDGHNPGMSGDCSRLRGDCSELIGDCSGLRGDCSGLRGDCSELRGDLDECDLTDDDRRRGIIIADLVTG